MPNEVMERQERSSSPSGAQRALRQQLRFLRELTEFDDAALLHRPPRRVPGGLGDGSAAQALRPPPREAAAGLHSVNAMLGQLRSFGGGGDAARWQAEDAAQRQPLPAERAPLPPPPPCAFLRAGQEFRGWQRVAHWVPDKTEQWQVAVRLERYDEATGRICGTMTATSVPEAERPVVTFFEGEVVDNQHASFYTTDWSAAADTDLRHWARFPAFAPLRREVLRHGGRAPGLAACGTVFMRWKELFFISGGECRLTIQGFYYAALCRKTGAIEAFYYDQASAPDQRVCLDAVVQGGGHAFPAYELA